MKFALISLLALCFGFNNYAQSGASLNKEKLLDYYQNQKYSEAGEYLVSVYPNNTNDYNALSQIAYCFMMAGKLAAAEKMYLKMDSIKPNTISVLFSLANITSRRGNNALSVIYLQNVIEIDSNNFNSYKRLADLTDSANLKLRYLKKANSINNTDADVAFDLAKTYRSKKQHLLAYETLKTAINADTGNFTLQRAILPIGNDVDKYKEVISIGEKLLKQANADADAIKDLAKAYFFTKYYKRSIAMFKIIEKWGMQNETTLYYTTLCYRELKDSKLAALYAQKLVDEAISPNTTVYYILLAGIYESNNQLSSAIAAYTRGLTFRENSTIYYRLALLYDLRLKQPKTALKYYKLYTNAIDLGKEDKAQVDYSKERISAITNLKLRKKV